MGLLTTPVPRVPLQLSWISTYRDTGRLIEFDLVELDKFVASGVYMIYQIGLNLTPVVIYAGKGNVPDRIGDHRDDARIGFYRRLGVLHFTYANVLKDQQEGVEAYLGRRFAPLVGERYPNVPEIEVNSPFAG